MFTVALVGHSGLPKFESYDDVFVDTFQSKGAILTDIWSSKFSPRMLQQNWDCVILFLGGNDLRYCRDQGELFDRFLACFHAFNTAKIFVTDIEPRTYYDDRWDITTEEYRGLSGIVNNRLRRYCKNRSHLDYLHIPPAYFNDTDDGIHMGPEGMNNLIAKYKRAIQGYRSKLV